MVVLEKNDNVGTKIVKIAKIRGAPPASFAHAYMVPIGVFRPAPWHRAVVRAVRPRILFPRARRLSTCISRHTASVVGLTCAVVALCGHKRGHFGEKVVENVRSTLPVGGDRPMHRTVQEDNI